MTLQDKCIGIYQEIEALGQLELKVKKAIRESEETIKVLNQNLQAIKDRKSKCKAFADQNLDDQEAYSMEYNYSQSILTVA